MTKLEESIVPDRGTKVFDGATEIDER